MLADAAALTWLGEATPTVIVAGCGVSMGGTTPAPGVGTFLKRTMGSLEQHAGFDSPEDPEYRQPNRLFPEAVYGAIGEAFDTNEHLRAWSSLGTEAAAQLGAVPAVGHVALVQLSAAHGWPIITTNFDCLFESAAGELGYELSSYVPTASERLVLPASTFGRPVLVKIHGTADNYETVKSTAADLSRCSQILERLAFSVQPVRALVVGYSGRDFDLFPWLSEEFGERDVLWVDRDFDGHRALTFKNVSLWKGTWDTLAEQLVSWSPNAALPGAAMRWSQVAEEAVDEHVGRRLASPGGQAIGAMIGVLVATGAHMDAARLSGRASAIRPARARVQALLWGAHAHASVDRFPRARSMARAARRQAWLHRNLYGAGRAAVAISYSRVSNYWLTVLPDLPRRPLLRLQSILSLASVAWVSAAWAPLAAVTVRRLRRASGAPRTAPYRFAAEYLEHLVRLMALLDGLRKPLPRTAPWLDRWWAAIQDTSASVGYTWGVFNVSKFISRHKEEFTFDGPKGSVTRSDAIGDLVGQAIARRDAAKWLIERDSPGDRDEATRLLDVACQSHGTTPLPEGWDRLASLGDRPA